MQVAFSALVLTVLVVYALFGNSPTAQLFSAASALFLLSIILSVVFKEDTHD